MDTNDTLLGFMIEKLGDNNAGSIPVREFYVFWNRVTEEYKDTYADVSYDNLCRLASFPDSYFKIEGDDLVPTKYIKRFDSEFVNRYIYDELPDALRTAIRHARGAI